jgi:hypothetical protein
MTNMPLLKALAEKSPEELTVRCHKLSKGPFPNFRHEETNLSIFPEASKSKRQIIFGNLNKINQSSTQLIFRLSHGQGVFFFLIIMLLFYRVTQDTMVGRGRGKGGPGPEVIYHAV